jgi:hypothetical protein
LYLHRQVTHGSEHAHPLNLPPFFQRIVDEYRRHAPLWAACELLDEGDRRFIGADHRHRFTRGNRTEGALLRYAVSKAAAAHYHHQQQWIQDQHRAGHRYAQHQEYGG